MLMTFTMINFLMSLMMMFMYKKYILTMLMSLEFMVLSMLMILMNLCSLFSYSWWMMMFYLIFSICEATIGISLMINLIRMFSNLNVSILNLQW